VYEVITEPFDAGSVQLTVTFPVPAVTARPEGASGAFAGTIADVGIEATDETAALLAVEFVTALNV
jgi:hypothetical protein